MILQSLVRYYEILASDVESKISPPGYTMANISHALVLSPQGELLDIFSLYQQVERGKKVREVPLRMRVFESLKSSGTKISPNFLWDNPTYLLGISLRDETDPKFSLNRCQAFREFNLSMLSGVESPEARAVCAFLTNYDPEKASEHPVIAAKMEELLNTTGSLVFKLEGEKDYIHEAPEIKQVWESYRSDREAPLGQCLVTGEVTSIARLHNPALKGVTGAQSSGAKLVSFNDSAYESYNRAGGQGLNSPVGERAAFAYATALNYLLSADNPNPKFSIGDTTVVYWAESPDPRYAQRFAGLFEFEIGEEAEEPTLDRDRTAEQRLKEAAAKIRQVQAFDSAKLMEDLDPNTQFYVLGLAPNASRVSVRFFHSDPFKKVVEKILQHYEDLRLVKEFDNQPEYIPLWRMLGETVSKKAADPKASPLMAGAVMRAILTGAPYPAALYYALINRVHADNDNKEKRISKVNHVRAAIIKAYLLRKYRRSSQNPFTEALQMSLNTTCTHPAYVLGRLFAVLESLQIEAARPNKLNSTIKDRFFTSACANPASVFPTLLRLSQHWAAKAEYGYISDRRIQDLMDLLEAEPFPAHLPLDEQGIFILGYYHQRANFFSTIKEKMAEPEPSSN